MDRVDVAVLVLVAVAEPVTLGDLVADNVPFGERDVVELCVAEGDEDDDAVSEGEIEMDADDDTDSQLDTDPEEEVEAEALGD